MKVPIRIVGRFLVVILLAGPSRNLLADGFRLPDQDAFATARGEAFTATADNASAIYYNPAGICQLKGWNFRAGIYGIDLPLTYEQPHTGRSFENNKTLQAAPQIFGTYGLNDYPITFGLGVFALTVSVCIGRKIPASARSVLSLWSRTFRSIQLWRSRFCQIFRSELV